MDILRPFLENKVRKLWPDLANEQIREKAAIDLERLRQDIQDDVEQGRYTIAHREVR